MGSFQQALLMDDPDAWGIPPGSPPGTPPGPIDPGTPGPATCVADQYYSCGPDGDPYWEYVLLQLPFDSNFTDVSNNALTGTVLWGSPGISSTNKKYGTGSLVHDSSEAVSIEYTLPAYTENQSWTFEAWVYRLANQNYCGFMYTEAAVIIRSPVNSGNYELTIHKTGGFLNGVTQIPLNQWTHIAATMEVTGASTATYRLFVNGVLDASHNSTIVNIGNVLSIGRHDSSYFSGLNCHIDDYRITRGVARYTGNFTIPAEAYPDYLETVWSPTDPRTVFLSHAEDTTDYSCAQEKTITLTGTASVSPTQYKFGSNSFSIANAGTSTLNGVAITDHQDFDFGVNDFTIEMWGYRSAHTYAGTLFYYTTGGAFSFVVAATTGLITLNYYSSNDSQTSATGVAFPLATWAHVVVQRRGTNFECYLNGTLINTTAITDGAAATVNSTGAFYLGRTNTSSATSWNGYIDEIRITKGVARYSENVVSDDPYWADVALLVQGGADGSLTLQDLSRYGDTATITNYAEFSDAHTVFGANTIKQTTIGSAIGGFITGTGSGSRFGRSTTSKLSVECWVNIGTLTNLAPSSFFFSWWCDGNRILEVGTYSNSTNTKLRMRNGNDTSIESASLSAGEHFIQLNMDGTSYALDVDGTEVYTGSNTAYSAGGSAFTFFAAAQTASGSATGPTTETWVTPIRVTNGILRSRGSVPTAAFPTGTVNPFDPETLPWCESTTAGETKAVAGTSPLTGMALTVRQQSIGDQNGMVALLGSGTNLSAGTVGVIGENKDKIQALTGRSVTVSRGSVSVPSYPTLYNRTFTGMTNTAAFPARVRLTLFSNGTILVRDQNLNTLASSTWIDTTQTNYVISDIANLYRVTSVVYLAGASYTTATAVPAALSSAFIVTAENGVLFSAIVGFDFQLTIAPTTSNPRYGEPGYSATIRCSGSLETGA